MPQLSRFQSGVPLPFRGEVAMKGLMQEVPLNVPMIVRHAERMHPGKTVTTRTADGRA